MEHAQHLLTSCLQRGITNFVLCPGARNAPLVLLLERTEGLELYYHPDERGAAFFALGRVMAFGEPCAVITTSGTAVAECLPAVVEAHYQARPLVIISADRPEAFRHSGAPQAIIQTNLFGPYAQGGIDYLPSNEPLSHWDGITPLHLNLPLEEDFSHSNISPLDLGQIQPFQAYKASFDGSLIVQFLRERLFGGLVLMIGGLRSDEREAVFYFAEQLGVPVIADPHSGMREALQAQLLVRPEETFRLSERPSKVLRLGEVPHGRFWRDLESHTDIEVLSVCNSGYSGLARPSTTIKGNVGRILNGIGTQEHIGDILDHLVHEQSIRNQLDELLEAYPSAEPSLVRSLSIYAAMGESTYLGNSLPIREWATFAQRDIPVPEVWANRGANGIDGQIATWLGTTREVENAWCIIGDLTALYDLNALIMSEQVELTGRRLVIINNGGGRIFSHLPRLQNISEQEADHFAQAHQTTFEHYAKMWGWEYQTVRFPEDLDEQAENSAPILIEVFPDTTETEEYWINLSRHQ